MFEGDVAMTKTEETMREVFQIHLPYEIDRLIGIYELLADGKWYQTVADPKGHLADALIVGFCTHARNLLEFFFHKEGTYFAAALDYATKSDNETESYERLNLEKEKDANKLYKQLCAQINHLTYERTDETSKKIGPKEREELVKLIHKEARRLSVALKPPYDAMREYLRLDKLANAAAIVVIAEEAIGPSSQFSAISSRVGATTTVTATDTVWEINLPQRIRP